MAGLDLNQRTENRADLQSIGLTFPIVPYATYHPVIMYFYGCRYALEHSVNVCVIPEVITQGLHSTSI